MNWLRQQEGRELALYVAAGIGFVVFAALFLSHLLNLDESSVTFVTYSALITVFYAALLVFAKRLLASSQRRLWFALSVVISLVIIFMSGGPSGFVVFGPSTLILAWLSVRG